MNQTEINLRRIRAYNRTLDAWKEDDHPRDKNGRFKSGAGESALTKLATSTESKPAEKDLQTTEENGNIKLTDLYIYKSLGAKSRNIDILDRVTGEIYHLLEGTHLQNSQCFAGAGTKKPLDDAVVEGVCRELGAGDVTTLQHCKADGYIDVNGEGVLADIHWFQVKGTSINGKWYIKRWLE